MKHLKKGMTGAQPLSGAVMFSPREVMRGEIADSLALLAYRTGSQKHRGK